MTALPDLMRRLNRKLDIQRGLSLSYDDLALLVASGAYATLQEATRQHLERQCREHVARSRSTREETTPSTKGPVETLRSSGTTETDDANEALARLQRTLRQGRSHSTNTTSGQRVVSMSRLSARQAR